VALVTVGVIVGQGGLGQIIIVNGFGANYYRPPIVFGTLACVVLALVADQLLALAQRLLTPWARTGVAA
jgi:osmoprotectant transport system permease protein